MTLPPSNYNMFYSSSTPLLLVLLLILLLAFSIPSICSSTHAKKQPQVVVSNHMLPSEVETLFKIMDSMSSDENWRISYPNPCQPGSIWPGMECKLGQDSHFHVSRLDFGIHPNPTCKNTATFPYQIFTLPYLVSAFFFNCFTHAKTTLSVSPNRAMMIFNSSSLQQLSLRSNPALFGPIPPQISYLRSLQILTLSQNSLSGHIPVEIFGLSSLVHLDLSYNMLTGPLPIQLGNLKNLQGLDLSYNSLTGPIPTTIGHLGMLQKLDLSSNSFMGTIPYTVENLKLLTFMAMSNNKLRGSFPAGMPKLQSLQYFIMDDNPMYIPLPEDFGKLVKLQELRLANSGYSGTIPRSFSLLANLTTLSLQNNRLTGEIPVGFGSLSRIYHLNLSGNSLDGVVPFNLSFLKRLGKNLDLSGNSGLCLSPSEAYGKNNIRIGGVGVCGARTLIKKSQAPPHELSKSLFLYGALIVHGLHQILFPVLW